MLYNDVNLINTEIEMYRTITPEDIRTVAKKYLNKPTISIRLRSIIRQSQKIIQNYHEKNNIYTIKSFLTLAMQGQIIRNQHHQLLRQLRLVNPIILS
jgi:predicted Zn-dependent peptidase